MKMLSITAKNMINPASRGTMDLLRPRPLTSTTHQLTGADDRARII